MLKVLFTSFINISKNYKLLNKNFSLEFYINVLYD